MSENENDLTYLLDTELPEGFKSGFVTVIGKPNVGKSTLMNALLGEKLAIVSPKPQTTRDKQLGILTDEGSQIVFVDTPGIHLARTKLGEYMVDVAKDSIPDADVIVFIVDTSEPPDAADRAIAEAVNRWSEIPAILALNKIDLFRPGSGYEMDAYKSLVPDATPIEISALNSLYLDDLHALIIDRLPEGPLYYPPEQLTETHLRDNAAEIIREQILLLYEEEIPHATGVVVEEFKERTDNLTYIRAVIYVERASQKGILIGKNGAMLKKLGAAARHELQDLLDTKIYLDLWVKVLKNWRQDENAIKRLGYRLEE